MNKKAAIIIVNWNGYRFLENCLSAVFNQTYTNFDVYFVDNASHDESVSFVRERFPAVDILQLSTNTGFAKGNNEGIKEAFKDPEVEYIVCLNNDTVVEREWLGALVNEVNYEKKIDMVGSLSLLPDGRVYSIGGRFRNDLNDLSIGYGQDKSLFMNKQDIFSPHGVSVLYTRRLLEQIGLFDETFFAYCEEFDLGLRARNVGYKAIYTPYSILTHHVSQSSGGMANKFKAFQNKRNSYFVAIKNFPLVDLVLFPFRDILWSISKLSRPNNTESVTVLKEKIGIMGVITLMVRVYWGVLIHTPEMIYKRFKTQKY